MFVVRKLIIIISLAICALHAAPHAGEKAYEVRLPKLSYPDSEFVMKQKGVILLNIWASWCKGCKKEMPLFHRIGAKYQSKGLEVIAVNIDKKMKKAEAFVQKLNHSLGGKSSIVFLHDKDKKIAQYYEAEAIPFSLLIKNGKIEKVYLGSFDETNEAGLINDIEAAL